MDLTQTEKVIIDHIVSKERLPRSAVVKAYTAFVQDAGLKPQLGAPSWAADLWREAQERRGIRS